MFIKYTRIGNWNNLGEASLIKSISINNVEYRPNFIIVLDDKFSETLSYFPCFVKINEIFEVNEEIYFNCIYLEIVRFEEKLNAFSVKCTESTVILNSCEIKDRHPNIFWRASKRHDNFIAIKYYT